MAKVALSLDKLGEIDSGAARAIIDAELARMVADVEDRGDDGKPRQTIIVVTTKKQKSGYVDVEVECHARLPKRRSRPTVAEIAHQKGEPKVLFQEYSPDNPRQSTLDALEQQQPPKQE